MNFLGGKSHYTRRNPLVRRLWQALGLALLCSAAGAFFIIARDVAALNRVLGFESQALFAASREAEELHRELLRGRCELYQEAANSQGSAPLASVSGVWVAKAKARFAEMGAAAAKSPELYGVNASEALSRLRLSFDLMEKVGMASRVGAISPAESLARMERAFAEALDASRHIYQMQDDREFRLHSEARDIAALSRWSLAGLAALTILLGAGFYQASRRSLTIARRGAESFRLAASAVEGAIFDRDLERGVVSWSEGLSEVFGHPLGPAQMTEAWFLEFIHPEDRDLVAAQMGEAIERAGEFDLEFRVLDGEGAARHVLCRGQAVAQEGAPPRRVVGTVVDIAKRKKAEQALRESEGRFQGILNNASACVYLKDLEGRYIFANYRFLDITGLKREEVLGRTDNALFGKEMAEQFARQDAEVIKVGIANECEELAPGPGGTLSTYITNKFPLFDSRGEVYAICGISTDIAERKKAENKMRESEARYRRLVEMAPFSIYVHDGEKMLFSNEAGARMIGAESPEAVLGRPVKDFVPAEFAEKFEKRMREAPDMPAGGPMVVERLLRLDGGAVEVEGVGFPMEYEGRQAFQVMVLDVGERKRAERLQRAALRIAEAAGQADDLTSFFDSVRESLAEAIDTTNFHVALSDPRTGDITFPYFHDERCPPGLAPEKSLVPVGEEAGKTLAAYVIRTRRSLLANEEIKERLQESGEVRRSGSLSKVWLGVPLISAGRVVGVVSLQSYDDPGRYAARDVEVLEFVAGQIARAVEKSLARDSLRAVVQGTAGVTGEDFFISLAKHLATALASRAALVCELEPLDPSRARTLAVWKDNSLAPNFEYSLEGTPCSCIATKGICSFRDGVAKRFPKDATLQKWNAESYVGVPLLSAAGSPVGLLAVVHDKPSLDLAYAESILKIFGARAAAELERKRAADELAYQAFHDPLTGLPNRALFMDRMRQAATRSERHHESFAVLFIDLDRFKYVNDSLGHSSGDELISEFGSRLRECERDEDTVARWGGDEFTVLVERIASPRDAIKVAERVIERAREPFRINGHEIFVSASVGIALNMDRGERSEDLLRDADAAMYRAKARGKARYEIFNASMHREVRDLMRLEADLRRAIDRREFRVHYQPKIALASGQVSGFEALARWEHPKRGMVGPARFVALAEETGLILEIDYWVMEQACRQACQWRDEFGRDPAPSVSANLSARHFQQGKALIEHVANALRSSGLPPASLRLEITESVMVEDSEAALEVLKGLKGLGVKLELDDFGSGYASLSYLSRFPFDTLKIDRSFVRDMPGNRENTAIVMAIMAMASNLGLEVTAEGVETSEQMCFLRDIGCELGQGYLFAKPLSADDASDMLRRNPVWV